MPLLGPRSMQRRSIRPPAGCGKTKSVVSRTWSRSVEQGQFQRLQPVAPAAGADPAERPGPAAGALASHPGVLIGTPSAWLYSGYQEGSCGMNRPEQRTIDVDVETLDTRGRTLHGYAAVYNVESEDLGGCSAPR